jgi:DNA-binding response OmpR family regulator
VRHPGQTLTKQQLLDWVWPYDREVQPATVEVYIYYLRRKLARPGRPDPIQTVRGVGYRLEAAYV